MIVRTTQLRGWPVSPSTSIGKLGRREPPPSITVVVAGSGDRHEYTYLTKTEIMPGTWRFEYRAHHSDVPDLWVFNVGVD